jgi:hypothetical protein
MLRERAKQQTREERLLQLHEELTQTYYSFLKTCDKLAEELAIEIKDALECLFGRNSIGQCFGYLDLENGPGIAFYIQGSSKYELVMIDKLHSRRSPGPEYILLREILSTLLANIGVSQCKINDLFYDYYIARDDVDRLTKELQEILSSEVRG